MMLVLAGGLLCIPTQAQKKNVGAWKRPDSLWFRYPMDITPEISGSFAELRATHFHGGMDFRTQQREGIKVYGIAPGWIIRAETSRTGYGKALYVQHEEGLISLYAHLSKFGMGLEGRLRKARHQSHGDEVRLDNLHIKVPAKRPIARSGNTGSSGGPHLHLEIRRDSLRLNPACFGLKIPDSLPPILYYMAVYQPSRKSSAPPAPFLLSPKDVFVDSCMRELFMDAPAYDKAMYQALDDIYADFLRNPDTSSCKGLSPRNVREPAFCLNLPSDSLLPFGSDAVAAYYTADALPDTLWVNGACAFGLCTLDTIQHMPFHYGLYELTVLVREEVEPAFADGFDTLAFYRLDKISDALYSNIRQHLDPLFHAKTKKRLEKAWVMPEKGASPYSVLRDNGVLLVLPGSFYRLKIIARDFSGNESVLECVMAKD